MSRKTIIVILAIILFALCAYAYVVSRNTAANGTGAQKSSSSLFPFGNPANGPTNQSGTTTTPAQTTTTSTTSTPVPEDPLIQISDKLIAGLTFLPPGAISRTDQPTSVVVASAPDSTTTTPVPTSTTTTTPAAPTTPAEQFPIVRFAEKGTGYIYDVDARGNDGTKASGTVVAETAEADFADNGTAVLLRYIKDDNQTIATFLGQIVPPAAGSTDDGTLTGSFLPDSISEVAISPNQKNILFLLPLTDGVAGISMKANGTAKKQLFESAFSEWLLDWTDVGPVLTTKANADTPGYAYSVSSDGIFQKIIGDVNGLTTKMSPDGKTMLYSVSGGQGLDLHILHLKDGSDINTGLQTLPEKCVWSSDDVTAYCAASAAIVPDSYPDAWYQGVEHFNDGIWKVDTVTGTTTEVTNGEGKDIDATNLVLDQGGRFIAFINKNDGTLWSLDLTPAITPPTPTTPPDTSVPSESN